jgi:hypothetical protein
VSIDTTNIYAEVDLERKAEVLAHSNALCTTPSNNKHWKDDPSLMNFLRSLWHCFVVRLFSAQRGSTLATTRFSQPLQGYVPTGWQMTE